MVTKHNLTLMDCVLYNPALHTLNFAPNFKNKLIKKNSFSSEIEMKYFELQES